MSASSRCIRSPPPVLPYTEIGPLPEQFGNAGDPRSGHHFDWIYHIIFHSTTFTVSIYSSSALHLREAMICIRPCGTPQHSLSTADQCRGYPFKRPRLWLPAAHAKKLRSRRSNGASSHRGSFPDLTLLSLVNCPWSSLLPRVHVSRELCQSVPRSFILEALMSALKGIMVSVNTCGDSLVC